VTRRIAVLTAGAVLLLVFGVLGTTLPVPYVAQVPGPTYNTLGKIDGKQIIEIQGRKRNDVEGNLNLTTVGVGSGGLSLVQAVRGWFDSEVSVVPRESVYPPDKTEEQTRQANREQFLTSEQAAEIVALGHLGYPEKVVVQGVPDDSPSHGRLEEEDAIEAVDGRPTPDAHALDTVLSSIDGGSTVTVTYTRLGKKGSTSVTTETADDGTGARLGITILDQPSAPFDVDIQVEDVGGPSAGLMLTLGILDLVGTDDLTGGSVIAGTGTIDADGKVGPIGGIAQKLVGAQNAGAEYFLAPADTCADVVGRVPDGLTVVKVSTLDQARRAVESIGSGADPGSFPGCG
jgi:PDZ domain-containing protein